MPILLLTSSFKTNVAVVIAGIFSFTAAIILTVPSVSHFVASSFPIVYDNTVFLLKPPYLYLVINCIIVSIVATSKLAHKYSSNIDEDSDFSEVVTPVIVVSESFEIDSGYLNVVQTGSDYTGFVEIDSPVDPTVEDIQKFPKPIADDNLNLDDKRENQQKQSNDSPESEKPKLSSDSPESEKPKLSSDSPETEKMEVKKDSSEISVSKQTKKPPRYNKQRSLKANPEGGGNRKPALGVTKPHRRQDTLESTWKKITEGRPTPLNKRLTKSDTWQERSHVQTSKEEKKNTSKSEISINDVKALETKEETTRLKREASPGQEELNRRVEAFIKKFNEEMRLQRLESLAKYNEIVNGGTSL
ncbi:unnamed protein product [Cochlearia groenlandica]